VRELNNGRVVLTKGRVKTFDLVIAFSYVFVFFNILLIITFSLNNLNLVWRQASLNFENKLLLAMLFVLVLSFAMVTAGTIYYNSSQFEQKHNTNISEKLESVLKNLEMEEDKGTFNDSSLVVSNSLVLSDLLKKLSNIYYTDINLYDYEGGLIASSRPEIFKRGLIGTLMDPEAIQANEYQ
jgi:two-component system nitrogen regulation sensor histidine kinase NtrY